MLTGQFNELLNSIGSGIPVRIHKLDNNGTVVDLQVDYFTKAEEIPYPWNDHPWSDSFIGYSVSRNTLKRAGAITSPMELYCFYDADVTLTFKLPIPGAKRVSIQYGVGQYPQLHDITGNGTLLLDADENIMFCLPDGGNIDGMPKPLSNTDIEVIVCNKPELFYTDSMTLAGNGIGYGLKSDGKVMSFSKICTSIPKVNITPVSIDVPQRVNLVVTGNTAHFGYEVPVNFETFSQYYYIDPQVSEVSGTGYLYCAGNVSGTTKLIGAQTGVSAQGFIFGSVTTSKPTSFPTGDPALVDKAGIKLNNSTYHGYAINNMSISRGEYIPFRLRARLEKTGTYIIRSCHSEHIIMGSVPSGVTSSYSQPTLRDWLDQGDDSSVAEWWRSNYSSIFYTV